MTTWLDPLLAVLAAHPYWAALVVGLVAFAESLVVVGIVVPGAVVMFGAGALIGGGTLAFWPVMISAVVGAVAGDALSFWIGRRYGGRIRGLWPLRRHPEALDRGVRFFHAHGGKSVLIGRFVGPVRPIIPAVAGMLGMPPLRFALVNVSSAILWAPAYLFPGMVFAASLAVAAAVAGRLAVLLVGGFVLAWGLILALRHARRLGRRLAVAGGRRLTGPWGRWLRQPVVALRRRTGAAWWGAVAGVVVSVGAALTLARPAGWERLLVAGLAEGEGLGLVPLATVLTVLGGAWAVVAATAVAAAWLWGSGERPAAGALAASVAGALALAGVLEPLVGAATAGGSVDGVRAAFPSAAAAGASALAFAVAVLASPAVRGARAGWFLGAGVLAVAVALARVAVTGDTPLDVIAGVAIGGAAAGLAVRGRPQRRRPAALVAVVLAGAVPGALVQDGLEGRDDPVMTSLRPSLPVTASCAEVRERVVADGLLWRGSAEALERRLARSGDWQPATAWSLRGALLWLSPRPDVAALPPLPRPGPGGFPDAVYRRVTGPEEREVLRGWRLATTAAAPSWWLVRVNGERFEAGWPVVRVTTVPASPPAALGASAGACAKRGIGQQRTKQVR